MSETSAKPLWQSKTFWANLVALAATILGVFSFEISAETQTAIVGGVMAVVNILMRLVSKEPVSLTGK